MDVNEKQKIQGSTKILRIIPKAYERSLELLPYLIAVSQPKKATQIISTLKQMEHQKQKQPELELNHLKQDELLMQNPCKGEKQKFFLKRIRKNQNNKIEVLLCKADSQNKDAIVERLGKFDLIQEIKQMKLPASAPLTKVQFQEWSKFWPINFVVQQIAKQIPHTQQSIDFLRGMCNPQEENEDFYLLDQKLQKILLAQKGECKQGTIRHPIMLLLQKWPQSEQFSSKPDKYYYLTGLKLLAKKQLCGMCSMALLHSRLHSIYLKLKPTQVMDQIMGCPKLNHQIIMFLIS